jgi:hypothetical protein
MNIRGVEYGMNNTGLGWVKWIAFLSIIISILVPRKDIS